MTSETLTEMYQAKLRAYGRALEQQRRGMMTEEEMTSKCDAINEAYLTLVAMEKTLRDACHDFKKKNP